MRYIRQFTRKQERNQTKTLEQQKHDLDLARKVLTAVTAFSFIGNPFAAMASTITRVDAPNTNLMENTNVGHIYAEKIVNNNTAVNRFQDFKIDAGDIANMYFQTGQNQNWADNLVNFVNTRIDVHGTLNAIKENKIGGIPVVDENGYLVGIVTNRDLRFQDNMKRCVSEVMTKENLITTRRGTDLSEATDLSQRLSA